MSDATPSTLAHADTTTFTMPSFGADMEKATVNEWLVKPGDAVKHGQVIVRVETDKGLIDVECFEDAIVDALLVAENTTAKVGAPLARLRHGGAAPAARRVRASPLARARARELHVDLATVTPSHGDRIVRADVEAAAHPHAPAPSTPSTPSAASAPPTVVAPMRAEAIAPTAPTPTSPTRARLERAPDDAHAAMRRAIAAAMTRSKREIPHYYLAQTVDMSASLAWLAAANEARPITARLLLPVLYARAVARAAAEHPEVNGSCVDGEHVVSHAVHLSFAVSMRGGGLIAPAIFDADTKSVDELMTAIADVTQRVRSSGVRASELSEGTITLTSLGDLGAESLLPVIQPPQVAIVGFGAVSQRPWVIDEHVVARPLVTVTFAGDHRVSDGARGARFLKDVVHLLMHPEEP